MGWYGMGWGWVGWFMMTLVMVAFWGLVIFAVVAIFRGTGTTNHTGKDTGQTGRVTRRDPMEILDERFARGEIDVDEYHARQEVLRAESR